MIGMAVLPSLLVMMETKKPFRVHVIDQAGWVFEPLRQSLNDTLKTGKPKFVLSRIDFEQKILMNF